MARHPESIVSWAPHARTLVAAVLAGLVLLSSPDARAVDITVTTTQDEVNSDGDCSLREALSAAISNQVRDACPAGSNDATDRVLMASGATYSLTIDADETQGLGGDLNIDNDAASPDVVLEVTGGGTATIAQDSAGEHRVLTLATNASVEMRDVTLRGGTIGSGSSGGAVSIGTGATLLAERCAFTDNFAINNGGAIFASGNLTADECLFVGNVAAQSAGAIIVGSAAIATITNSVFADNVALGNAGGAIRVTGVLDVSDTSFVDNRSATFGGAIANSNTTPGKVTIDSSCFVGNSDVAVDSFANAAQSATNSWWGASDGPSGNGLGGGDSVGDDFDTTGFLAAPPAGCRPQELVANGRFQLDADEDGRPDRWRTRRLQVENGDGMACGGAVCQLRLVGDGQVNQVLQTLDVPGDAGDSVTIRALASATNVPATPGKYLVELLMVHADGSRERKTLKFSPGTHGPEERSKTIVASEPYVKLKVRIEYGRASGTVQFDDVSVVLD